MQVKSWQISFVAVMISPIVFLYLSLFEKSGSNGEGGSSLGIAIIAGILIFLLIVSLIPTLLLIFNKTKKIGAITSILFSIILALFFVVFSWRPMIGILFDNNPDINPVDRFVFFLLSGLPHLFIFLAAGIYYFKVESKIQS